MKTITTKKNTRKEYFDVNDDGIDRLAWTEKKIVFVGHNIKYENKQKNKTLLSVATGTH